MILQSTLTQQKIPSQKCMFRTRRINLIFFSWTEWLTILAAIISGYIRFLVIQWDSLEECDLRKRTDRQTIAKYLPLPPTYPNTWNSTIKVLLSAFVCSGCHNNKIHRLVTYTTNLYLTVLVTGKSKIKMPERWVSEWGPWTIRKNTVRVSVLMVT